MQKTLEWRERAVIGAPDLPDGVELAPPEKAAEADTEDGGIVVAHLWGRPPAVILSVTFESPNLEEGEGPDIRLPTLPEIFDAIRFVVPDGAIMVFPGVMAQGRLSPFTFDGPTVWLNQVGARQGSDASQGLVFPGHGSPAGGLVR